MRLSSPSWWKLLAFVLRSTVEHSRRLKGGRKSVDDAPGAPFPLPLEKKSPSWCKLRVPSTYVKWMLRPKTEVNSGSHWGRSTVYRFWTRSASDNQRNLSFKFKADQIRSLFEHRQLGYNRAVHTQRQEQQPPTRFGAEIGSNSKTGLFVFSFLIHVNKSWLKNLETLPILHIVNKTQYNGGFLKKII